MQQANLGIVGGGTVGGGVFDALQRNGGLLASRAGVRANVKKSKKTIKCFLIIWRILAKMQKN
jgi:homoserine dehydrogenase